MQSNPLSIPAEDVEEFDIDNETSVKGGLSYTHTTKKVPLSLTLGLAFQSVGIIYGDVGTSPLYVFSSTFAHSSSSSGISPSEDHIVGALSLIVWTLTLIALFKYILVVLAADDNGEGGTFALYSLLCRHVRVGLRGKEQSADLKLSSYSYRHGGRDLGAFGKWLKRALEDYPILQKALLLVVMGATALAIGDGVFTPAISVLSAVSGLTVEAQGLSQDWVIGIACTIIVLLFVLQSYGTGFVGFLFAPIITVWYISISIVGLYNIVKYDGTVLKAVSPHYALQFLFSNGTEGWLSLGGILLCITGVEAMFADLGHFTQRAIQISFCGMVYPSLMIQYFGQAAYLVKNPDDIRYAFYKSIPSGLFWPMLVVATLAAIVASQAMITGTFSLLRQATFLDCFPPIKVTHTSQVVLGQVYVPEANWALMLLTLAVVLGFRTTETIGHAYGFAVIGVLLTTTLLMLFIMILVWRINPILAIPFFLFYFTLEAIFLSALIFKVPDGAWVAIVLSVVLVCTMYVWYYGTSRKLDFDAQNKVSMNWILNLGPDTSMARVPGFGLFYTELVSGVPPIFSHFIANLPALHQILVFVCVKHLPVPKVPPEERFLVRRVGPRRFRMYRCVVRLGYIQENEISERNHDFEEKLFDAMVKYINENPRESRSNVDTPENSWPGNVPFSRAQIPLPPEAKGLGESGIQRVKGRSSTVSWQDEFRVEVDSELDKSDGLPSTSGTSGPSQGHGSMEELLSVEKIQTETEEMKAVSFSPMIQDSKLTEEEKAELESELLVLEKAKAAGMVYVVSRAHVRARKSSWWGKRWVVNGFYSFLSRNFRDTNLALGIPHNSLLEVGMVYVI